MVIIYGITSISGLNSDTKPLNVPEFSHFIETETLLEFLLIAGVWTALP